MGNFLKKTGFIIPVSAAGIIWTVIVLTCADFEKANFMFWGGFVFCLLAFIATDVILYLVINKTESALAEHNALVYKATAAYLGISLLLNTIFVIIAKSTNKPITIIPNVIIILVYISALALILRDSFRISELGGKIDSKTIETKATALDLSSIILKAEDEDVKNELKKLKEAVVYSEQIGISATKQIEDQFNLALVEIDTLIDSGEAKEEILRKIKFASNLWAKRNSMISMMR